jgi:hypothetical protein
MAKESHGRESEKRDRDDRSKYESSEDDDEKSRKKHKKSHKKKRDKSDKKKHEKKHKKHKSDEKDPRPSSPEISSVILSLDNNNNSHQRRDDSAKVIPTQVRSHSHNTQRSYSCFLIDLDQVQSTTETEAIPMNPSMTESASQDRLEPQAEKATGPDELSQHKDSTTTAPSLDTKAEPPAEKSSNAQAQSDVQAPKAAPPPPAAVVASVLPVPKVAPEKTAAHAAAMTLDQWRAMVRGRPELSAATSGVNASFSGPVQTKVISLRRSVDISNPVFRTRPLVRLV